MNTVQGPHDAVVSGPVMRTPSDSSIGADGVPSITIDGCPMVTWLTGG